MKNKKLHTVDQVVETIGRDRVKKLTGKDSTHLCNWSDAGNFPPTTYVVLTDELKRIGCSAPPSLWRMIESVKQRAA